MSTLIIMIETVRISEMVFTCKILMQEVLLVSVFEPQPVIDHFTSWTIKIFIKLEMKYEMLITWWYTHGLWSST
jgi:hypothetical protein